jgi:glycosyltransferase involved in cell wall biosynthesis
MSPKVSVVIASYNHAPYIGTAIQSILDQSFQDFEIVITDDSSSDNSADVIRRFKDPRISLEVLADNYGPSIAMNSAIRRSHGEFIANLGSDDFFLPHKLEKQIAYLKTNENVAAVFGMPIFVSENGGVIDHERREFTFPFSYPQPARHEWLRHFFFVGNCLCHPTVLIRKSVHDQVGLYEPGLMSLADYDLWIRVCLVNEIHVIQDELIGRRLLGGNRNLSAPRRDTFLRTYFERSRILNHYSRLVANEIEEIFGRDITEMRIDPTVPYQIKLAELALHSRDPALHLFGLTMMFEAKSKTNKDYRHLIEATGAVDVFGIGDRLDLNKLRSQMSGLVVDHEKQFFKIQPESKTKVSRNDPCPCGSGKRYKHCHGKSI